MRAIIVELRKNLTSAGFFICVLFTVVLLFCAEIYTDRLTMERYSAIRALLDLDRAELAKQTEFENIMVMSNARNGWITLFVPIITAFCFVLQVCAERAGNAVRYGICRSSKIKYNLSRCFSGIVSGGLALALGYAIFCGLVFFMFPNASEMSEFSAQAMENSRFDFLKAMLGMWLYGAFWSIPAMFCTSVMRNKYLIICIPFFLKYAMTQTSYMLSNKAYADLENINYTLAKFVGITRPEALLYIDGGYYSWGGLLFYIALAAAFIAGFGIIQCSRRDCGE
ncbi:MAG: hypothetical protein J1F28_09755 [Oscillospiraceae bacterium]|nr:hypothetical protein [Oscillospiraceae bacterium]